MNKNKCSRCGLVNFATNETCRRCGASLRDPQSAPIDAGEEEVKKRSIGRRLIWILGTTLLLLFIAYMSLLLTSQELGYEQTQTIKRSIALLDQKGFHKQAFVLNHLVQYRDTDNWWNKYVGHHDAYAATNFPFEIVTVYPEFFETPVDDTERAVILLHESYHLFGYGEEAALEGVWREKQKLAWTADEYGQTKVWNNTRELTAASVPKLFKCGADSHSDCVP
jgi:hypothetical protein